MDSSDSKAFRQILDQEKESEPFQGSISYDGNVLSTSWVRRIVQTHNGYDWFILGCRYRFLFNFRLLLALLYFAYQAFK